MEIKIGDKVNYFFPEPVDSDRTFITGIVETIADDYVFLKTDNDVKMKISFKNFHLIKHFALPGLKLAL